MRQQMLLATALVATQLVGHSAHAQIQPTGSSAWPSASPAQPPGNLPPPQDQPTAPAQPQPDPGGTVPPPASTPPLGSTPLPASTPPLGSPLLRHAPRVFSFTAGYVYVPLSQLPVARSAPESGTGRYQHHGLRLDWKAATGIQFFAFERQRVLGAQLGADGRPTGELSKAYTFNLQELKAPLIEAVTQAGWRWQPLTWNAPASLRWLTE